MAREAHGRRPRLDLKVGFRCNNRCTFCVQGDKRLTVADRTTEELKAILRDRREGASGVVFTGGEPTVRDDLCELVSHAHALGYRPIQVQTNGRRLAYMPFVRALLAAGATEVSPALHGSTEAMHDALTRAPGSFRQTVHGIVNAVALGLDVITNSVVVRANVADLPALGYLLVRLGVRQVQFAFVHPTGEPEKAFAEVVPRFSEAMPHIHRALDVVRRAGLRAYTEAVPYCFMRGYEDCVVESSIPDTCVVDRPMTIENYTEYRWKEGKEKGPPCERCTFVERCEGPWREYPREYGWDEFQPRTEES